MAHELSAANADQTVEKPRKKRKNVGLIRCAGAMCSGCELDVSPAEAFDQVLFCSECHDSVYGTLGADSDAAKDLYWFVAHVDHGVIAWSSDTAIVPPTPLPLGSSQLHPDRISTAIRQAAEFLAKADAILVMAGAGASIDSNLPDFRGRDGWYSTGDGTMISMEHVNFHPTSPYLLPAWRLKISMMQAFQQATPHSGYTEIVESLFGGTHTDNISAVDAATGADVAPIDDIAIVEDAACSTAGCNPPAPPLVDPSCAFVMTSNIDGVFERAGVPPEALYETHGSAHRFQCTSVGTEAACPASDSVWELSAETRAVLESYSLETREDVLSGKPPLKKSDLPCCIGCSAIARPNVSHITDSDDDICPARKAAQRSNALSWLERIKQDRNKTLVVLEIGCGTSEHSLRLDSEIVVARHRTSGAEAYLIRIDPHQPSVPLAGGGCIGVPLRAKDAIVQIFAAVKEIKATRPLAPLRAEGF